MHALMMLKPVQFPSLCDYQDASYSVTVRGRSGRTVDTTGELAYEKGGPDLVKIDLEGGMQRDKEYTATLNIKNEVNLESIDISFGMTCSAETS